MRDLNSVDLVAEELGIRQSTAESLLVSPTWDLETAFRVAEGLHMPVVEALEEVALASR
jgi:hypothetical protein